MLYIDEGYKQMGIDSGMNRGYYRIKSKKDIMGKKLGIICTVRIYYHSFQVGFNLATIEENLFEK